MHDTLRYIYDVIIMAALQNSKTLHLTNTHPGAKCGPYREGVQVTKWGSHHYTCVSYASPYCATPRGHDNINRGNLYNADMIITKEQRQGALYEGMHDA